MWLSNGLFTICFCYFNHLFVKYRPQEFSSIFIVVSLIVFATLILYRTHVVKGYIDILVSRTNSMIQADDITNGRIEIWRLYIEGLNQNLCYWVFGVGSYSEFGIYKMAHNMFLQDITTYGFVGSFILYILYISVFRQIFYVFKFEKVRIELFTIIPMLLPVIAGMTLHTLSGIANTFMLFFGNATNHILE